MQPPNGTFEHLVDAAKGRFTARLDRNGRRNSYPPEDYEILRKATVVRLSDVDPKPLRWLWYGRIPAGKFTLLCGDPGLGKSLFTMDMTGRVTTGRAWPDIEGEREPANVVILTAEDDLADTVRPRIEAVGGDVRRVYVIRSVMEATIAHGSENGAKSAEPDWSEVAFSLATDLKELDTVVSDTKAALVIIDPLSSYLGDTDSHVDAKVRGVLMPISDLAMRLGPALVGLLHLNKGSGRPAQYRVSGSVAFVAAARAAHVVTPDPEDPDQLRKLFLPLKQNLSKPAPGLAFITEGHDMVYENGVEVETARVVWQTGTVDITAYDALAEEGSAVEDGKRFLKQALEDGPQPATQMRNQARQADVSDRTLDRAKKSLHIRSYKEERDGRVLYLWALPEVDKSTNRYANTKVGVPGDLGVPENPIGQNGNNNLTGTPGTPTSPTSVLAATSIDISTSGYCSVCGVPTERHRDDGTWRCAQHL